MSAVTKILLVEDSITQSMRMRHVLEEEGFEVQATFNGEDALVYLESNSPDLVISDVMMPKMNGYDFTRKVRENPRFKDTPIMLVTTLSDPTDVIRALEAGADNFTTKPFNEQALIARIKYIMANSEIRRQRGSDIGIEVFFAGKKYFINSTRIQMIDFLLSTYESAIQKNQELFVANNKLKEAIDNITVLQHNYRQLLETNEDSILVFDENNLIRYANPAAQSIFSSQGRDLIGEKLPIPDGLSTQKEIELKDSFGNTLFLDVRSVTTDWDSEKMTLSVFRDVTESTQLRKELELISLVDDLTGLYNRRGFKILSERMVKTARRMHSRVFMVFADMDGLKKINDTLGHLEGDRALRTISGFFKDSFRETDLIARLGGDEFAVMGVTDESVFPQQTLDRMSGFLTNFNSLSGEKFKLSVSIGIEILLPDSQVTIEDALRSADAKMYAQKQKNKISREL